MIKELNAHSILGKIIGGSHGGEQVCLPRIDLSSKEGKLNTLRRRQYPTKPAFALSINKAQGQTLQHVGVFLPTPVFAHGQLDTAVTRVGDPEGLTIMVAHPPLEGAPDDGATYTRNIVYTEALPNLVRCCHLFMLHTSTLRVATPEP
jgi:ATP-dependent DNA helicase PIF1